MRSSRYSTTRQKACQACAIAKAKCDRKPESCTRCSNRGLSCAKSQSSTKPAFSNNHDSDTAIPSDHDRFQFFNLDLVCNINADDISNRWLNTYVPIPGQATKSYDPNISAFIHRMLKSYADSAVRGHKVPPFIHPAQITTSISQPLSTCLSVIRICQNPLTGGEEVATELIQREMAKIYERHAIYDDVVSLAAFQAYLIYAMVLFFRLGDGTKAFLRQSMMNLQEIACSTCRLGLTCLAEQQGTRPKWEAWILAEAKRRTLFAMYLFDSALSRQDGLPTFLGTELQGLLAPGMKRLWGSPSRRDWEIKYNAHLADWSDGFLHIEELWPMPSDWGEERIVNRRRRVDLWLEDLDEYGTMMYAVTSCTHEQSGCPSSTPAEQHELYTIFDKWQKTLIVFIVSTAATFSGFASNIYFPALPTIAEDLNVSVELVNLTVTTYLIFQALAPSLWGPISDVKGRRIAYSLTFLVFLGACIGLAGAKNYTTLIVLRCLQSTGSASTIAIGTGVISDITTRDDRGGYMGIFQAGLLAPVAIGPVIGGALAGSLGWRSIFWFLTIYGGVFLVLLILLLPETLRSIVANGATAPSSAMARYPLVLYQRTTKLKWTSETPTSRPGAQKHIDLAGPFRILTSKLAAPVMVFLAVYYAVWQMSITAMSSLFKSNYGLSDTNIGLTFLGNGAGSIIGTLVTGKILDVDYRRVKAEFESRTDPGDGDSSANLDFPLERARLRLAPVLSLLQCISITVFGWTIQYPHRVHIAVPIISTFVTGWAAISTQSLVMTYLIDLFPSQSAAASASLNLARCLFAASGTSFIMPMVNNIGVGWAFTICVGVQAVALVGVFVQWKYASLWRSKHCRMDTE
ncbi:major facilitator superfamily domain-containing protein [Ilyonectria sp. MPI-CAGE-AT-0026]|nr:major facilitator superfamily domain-containing protein [Ilyonectria sp. MPI-CAGE-AT-0026]